LVNLLQLFGCQDRQIAERELIEVNADSQKLFVGGARAARVGVGDTAGAVLRKA